VDIERIIGFGVLTVVMLSVGGLVVYLNLSTILRWHRKRRRRADSLTDERLARIETAVEAIAIEVERQGELLRFVTKLDAPLRVEPRRIERPTTPH
jgi:hypothetical protein